MKGQSIIPIGDYAPDLARVLNGKGLLAATNALPSGSGYDPMPSLVDMGQSALTKRPRGSISGVDRAGNPWNIVGTEHKLHEFSSGVLRDASAPGGYNCTGYERWAFVKFGSIVIASNYNDPMQYVDTSRSPMTFAPIDPLHAGVGVPRARHLGTVEDHVILGDVYDPVYGPVPDSIWWGAIGQPLSYPAIASDEAASLQSDRQPLRGAGRINAVVAGTEVGAIMGANAIWRADYRGGAIIFELTKVVPDHGLLVPELAVAFPGGIFYLAEDGFRVFDYMRSSPVGKDRVDARFFDDFDEDYPDRVWAIKDPDSTRIFVFYPGSGNTSGRPNKALVWDYVLNRFSTLEVEIECPTIALQPGVHLDTLPDDNLDDDDLPDFDERIAGAGSQTLGAWGTDFKVKTFTGEAMEATFETGVMSLAPGRRATTSHAFPLVEGNDHVAVAVAALHDVNSAIEYGPLVFKDAEGKCPYRRDGRYHSYRLRVGEPGFAGFDKVVALDARFTPTGMR